MKVICIDKDAWPIGVTGSPEMKIENGQTYEVIDVFTDDGYTWYELSIDPGFGYWERCFLPCSNIDETEMQRNLETHVVSN